MPETTEHPPRNPAIPSAIDMMNSPIGMIPCRFTGTDVQQFPEYFQDLCTAGGIVFRGGGWAIVQEPKQSHRMVKGKLETREVGSTQRHQRFVMLIDACKILVEKWLFANGVDQTAKKIGGVNRGDILRACLGLQLTVRVTIEGKATVTTVGKLDEIRNWQTQRLFDWLAAESHDPAYTERRRKFEADLPDF